MEIPRQRPTTSLALAAKGTNLGQNLNQYKLLKSSTPEGLVFLITKSLAEQNRKPMSPKQVEALGNAMDKYVKNRDALDNAGLKLVEAANSGDKNAYDIAAKDFTASNDILRFIRFRSCRNNRQNQPVD